MTPKLRSHQSELNQCIDGIITGATKFKNVNKIIMSVVPGGGKGSCCVNAGKLIKAGLVDNIVCIVPRQALQTQAEQVCMDPFFQKLFKVKISLRTSTNDTNPCRGLNGFITSFQALGFDTKKRVLNFMKRRRCVLIGDEIQYQSVGSPWYDAFNELYKAATYNILMSGTLSRADKKKIGCLEYKNGYVDLSGNKTTHVITYPRSKALEERAILPLSFHLYDSSMEWEEHKGGTKSVDSFCDVKDTDTSKALYTALETSFAEKLIDESLSHWLNFKKKNPASKILFICARIGDARRCVSYLEKLNIPSLLATSHESKECEKNIKDFKKQAPVLITIAVAYVGLDVPPVSHICILTRIRSNEWLEQAVSRATRVDKQSGSYSNQKAEIFAPKDTKFLKFVEAIEKEQSTRAVTKKEPEQIVLFPIDEIGDSGGGVEQGPCIPIGSQISELARSVLGVQSMKFERVILTPKQEEKDVRRDIDRYLKRYGHDQGYEIPFVNREAKKINNKARKDMTLYELKKFFSEIQRHFPLKNTGSFIPVSKCQPIFTDVGQKDFNINNENFF